VIVGANVAVGYQVAVGDHVVVGASVSGAGVGGSAITAPPWRLRVSSFSPSRVDTGRCRLLVLLKAMVERQGKQIVG